MNDGEDILAADYLSWNEDPRENRLEQAPWRMYPRTVESLSPDSLAWRLARRGIGGKPGTDRGDKRGEVPEVMKAVYHGDIAVIDLGARKLVGEKADYDLWKMVEEVLEGGTRKIVLDLSGLKWTNSTGIGIIISSWTMAQKEKADLAVVMSSQRLEDIFKVTNLKLIMKTFDTVEEALGGMS